MVTKLARTRRGRIYSSISDFDMEAAEPLAIDRDDASIPPPNPVADYLISWGLEQYVTKFKEHCIDLESLQLLTDEYIKELIPIIGHRVKLMSQIAMLKDIIIDAYPTKPTFEETTDLNSTICIVQEHKKETELENEMQLSKPNAESELYTMLSSCNEGRGLLLRYQENGLLDNASRRRLCNIIINNELKNDPDKKISSSRFYQLAYEIANVFKKENASVYFIPFTKFSPNQKVSAKGKLLDCFRQRRRDFIKTGLVRSKDRQSSGSPNESGSPCPGTSSNAQEEVIMVLLQNNEESDTSEKMLWLKNSCDPWETVETYWTDTTKTRLSLLQSKNMTIQQYYSDFKALNQQGGLFLLLKDYKALYPSHQELAENWFIIRPKILELAKKKKILKEILTDLDHANDETHDLAAFLSIPFLMTTSNVISKSRSKDKRMWRPSKQEASEGFITLVNTSTEIEETIGRRTKKMNDFDLTLQPFIIVVRSVGKTISARYIVVNNCRYEVTSVMSAVDACYKIIFVLNAQYPAECINVWQFIQTALFKVKTKYDRIYTTVNTLITDLNIQGE